MILRGMLFRGYCEGYFGRDGYEDKRVEDFGADWIVVRGTNGRPNFASFADSSEMMACVARWKDEPAGWDE